jgi:uncharacterized protein (DUF1015 family)
LADFRPFRALRFTPRAGAIETLLAPPYDIVPADQVAGWQQRSRWNVSRETLPGEDYQDARRWLEEAEAAGVLAADEPSLYVHEVDFDGRTRRDVIGALRLQPYDDAVVLPHERTHRGPKEDRLALMRATGVAPEPLWFLHAAELPAPVGEPTLDFDWEGERHRLWVVADGSWQAAVTEALDNEPVLIADGHHRYETTLAYSEELGGPTDAASRFTPALLTSLDDPGLEVLPTHRVLAGGVAVTGGEPVASLEEVLSGIEGRVAAGHYANGQFQVLPLEGELPLVELHRQVIDNILGKRPLEGNVRYTRDAAEAVRWVDEGAGSQAFFLPRPDLRQVLTHARAGMTLPQKSTYFYPKPPSGLVLHRLDPGAPI